MNNTDDPKIILIRLYVQLLEEHSITTYDFKKLIKDLIK
jgi:hypothetical protein